ncbi:hypothetical protein S7711_04312 [Stachybotrys chartarum IBT 7711]|uniref:Uncharacterized protein n=1 Tax=Stachybotrys chartarum (strain CBS 109288 / IBT 7711) TaxID=1280523 RepID=A0A084AJD5_STACB|nr:hypothetical protein S7711_04312 [Stachybotrys chartarum IBT 7711]KFA75828.1 hypothetical protein S40288_01921 [Stachybotrys chartarum IBT 40288]
MSFLTSNLTRRVAPVAASVPRAIAVQAPRTFTTSIAAQKTATETVKDGLKSVDRAVSDKIVDGIDLASAAAQKVKGSAEVNANEASAKAQELKGEASGKAQELKGEASGKASELSGRAKGAAEQAKGTAKGTAEEVKRNL